MACADGIQEYIETLRDLKASNADSGICLAFPTKFGQWKTSLLWQSWKQRCLCPPPAWCSSWALHRWRSPVRCCCVQGRIDVLTLFLFLMAASRMYDPMQERVAESGGGHCHAHQCGADE